MEFGDRLKTRREEPTKTRTLLRIIIYCLGPSDVGAKKHLNTL